MRGPRGCANLTRSLRVAGRVVSLYDYVAALTAGVMLTLLTLLAALRKIEPRLDLTWAWGAWALTLLVLSIMLGAIVP